MASDKRKPGRELVGNEAATAIDYWRILGDMDSFFKMAGMRDVYGSISSARDQIGRIQIKPS